MVPNERIRLLNVWKADIAASFSISEIMKLSKKETKPWVFNTLDFFVEQDILKLQKKGNVNIYSLNINNPVSIQLVHYLEVQESVGFPYLAVVSEIIESVPIKNFCLIVFGSYAAGKQKKTSDLDVCILIEKRSAEKQIKPYIEEVKLNNAIEIDEHSITFDEFVQMLLSREENLGKQIFRSHKIFYNPQIYYQLVKEAYRNGFKP